MNLAEISKKIANWVEEHKGLYVFSSTIKDKFLYRGLLDNILSHCTLDVYQDQYNPTLSHIDGCQNSIFVDDLLDMRYDWSTDKSYDHILYRKIIESVQQKVVDHHSSQIIFSPLYESFGSNSQTIPNNTSITGGSSTIYAADFVAIIYQQHLSLQKLRWENSDDYSDIDLKVLLRDTKIDTILK